MNKTVTLTNQTMQEILDKDSHIKYKLHEEEVLDQFKTKERRLIKIRDSISGAIFAAVVELDNNKKVTSTKTFKII